MSFYEELPISIGEYHETLSLLITAGKDCGKRCNTLRPGDAITEDDQTCLKNCALNFVGMSNAHAKFINRYVDYGTISGQI